MTSVSTPNADLTHSNNAALLRGFFVVLFSLICVPLLTATALGQQATLTDDSTYPSGVGSNQNLTVQGPNAVKGQPAAAAFIKFKITGSSSTQMGDIPSGTPGSDVKKATLRLFVGGVTAGGKFNVYRVTSPWSEDGTAAPAYDTANPVATNVTAPAVNSYFSLDVTPLVRQWLDCESQNETSGCGNYGLAFVADASTPTMSFSFDSKESGKTSHEARLAVLLDHVRLADDFTGQLAGDVTGTQGATIVEKVGGQTASDVAAAAAAVSAATENGTGGTLVRRDVNGSFSAGTVTADVVGNVTGNLTGNVTGNVSGNAGSVTNGVYTVGDQTVAGTKTFTSPIEGSVTGTASGITGTLDGAKVTGSVALADIARSVKQYETDPVADGSNAGQIILNTTSNNFKISDGTQWKVIGSYVARAESAATADVADSLAGTATVQASQISGKVASAAAADSATSAASAATVTGTVNAAQVSGALTNATIGGDKITGNLNITGSGAVSGTLTAGTVAATTQFNLGGSRVLSASGNSNLFAGLSAGLSNTTGSNNAFFGAGAGYINVAGTYNSFFGSGAGYNTEGNSNSFFGAYTGTSNTTGAGNSFFGMAAGRSNVDGNNNSFFGTEAGWNNTTGSINAFFGFYAGRANTTGSGNAIFGAVAGYHNSTGSNNSFFGTEAGRGTSTGSSNAFFGQSAGRNNTEGAGNTFSGDNAGRNNSTGSNNAIFGTNAGLSNTTENFNTFIGTSSNGAAGITNATALGANARVTQSNSVVLGNNASVGIGTTAPQSKLHVAGTIQIDGTGAGVKFPDGTTQTTAAMSGLSVVSHDTSLSGDGTSGSPLSVASLDGSKVTGTVANATTAVGVSGTINGNQVSGALTNATIDGGKITGDINASTKYSIGGQRVLSAPGSNNLFAGVNAGLNNTGISNSFFGSLAGNLNSTGSNNAFFGHSAGRSNTIGYYNAFFGHFAGYANSTGNSNAFFGHFAGQSNTTENGNTFLGVDTNGVAGITNATAVGYRALVTQSNSVVLGNNASVGIGTSAPQSKLHVAGTVQIDGTGSGVKFPDGTVQTTAAASGLAAVSHDATLSGAGTSASPLGVATIDGGKVTGTVANAANAANAVHATTADSATAAGNAANFTGNLAGDVTGTQGATVISSLAGSKVTGPVALADIARSVRQYETDPTADQSNAGQIILNTTANALKISDGMQWKLIGSNVMHAETADTASALASDARVLASQIDGKVSAAGTADTADALSASATVDGSKVTGTVANATTAANVTGTVDAAQVSGALTNATIDGGKITGNVNTSTQYSIGGQRVLSSGSGANVFVGHYAGTSNTTGQQNSFFGFSAGQSNTTGLYNSFFGFGAGSATKDAGGNSFFGWRAGDQNTAGGNSFFGVSAGQNNTTACCNSFFGLNTGYSNTTGGANSFFGASAGSSNTTGYSNSFFGASAGSNNRTINNLAGASNSFFGASAGLNNTTGGANSFFGVSAGNSNTTEHNNTFLGSLTNGVANITNATAIGHRAVVEQSNSLVLGSISGVNGATASTSVGIGTTAPQSKLHVVGTVQIEGSGSGVKFPDGTLQTTAASGALALITHDATLSGEGTSASPLGVATIDGSKVTGTVANATTAASVTGTVNAAQVSGALTNATIDGAKVTGTVASANNATTAGTANALAPSATIAATQVSGKVASAALADSAASVTGTINASQVNGALTNATIDASRITGSVASIGVPIGTMVAFGGPVANIPAGWKVCDGTALSRATYASLYSAIGNSWGGGDGSTTFNLPDLRGIFLRGIDSGAGKDPDGNTRTVGSIQSDATASHTHGFSYRDVNNGTETTGGAGGRTVLTVPPNGTFGSGSFGVSSVSTNTGSETRPKNAGVYWIIKVQ